MVNILVKIVFFRILRKSLKLKYSSENIIKWCITVNVVMYKNILSKGIDLILNNTKSTSDFLKIAFNTMSLINAINKVAAALIPPESEKKSIERPSRKLKIKNKLLSFFRGNKNTQTIYTNGFR
jgi:predicted hydrolase (HD superfamily)